MLTIFITFLIIVGLLLLFCRTCLTRVSGESMLPTLEEWDICLIRPIIFHNLERPKPRHIYVVQRIDVPEKRMIIKRLAQWYTPSKDCYFLGDNSEQSYDSRFFGTIPWCKVRGEVVFKICNVSSSIKFIGKKVE